jgi:DNA (cytosine-5)-methyltransferase 1
MAGVVPLARKGGSLMIRSQFHLDLHDELIVDNFAGGGGASMGIELALDRAPDIAVNHDPEAVAMHKANHPQTKHLCEDVFDVSPRAVCGGRPVGLAWFSPDCKHFSKAKGGKPRSKKIRGLAWVVLRWVNDVRPRIIILENVEEFKTWGSVLPDGTINPACVGWYFRCFTGALRRRGYSVQWRELRACDYGAPTIRKRLFLIARCDGKPIVWPQPTHGEGRKPYRAAAECIDWSTPCPSIFKRNRALADATCRRIAKGIMRYVVNCPDPFIVSEPVSNPLRMQCAEKDGYSELVSAFLAKHYGGVVGSSLQQPIGTVTSVDHHSLVSAFLTRQFGTGVSSDARDPFRTVMAGGGGGKSTLVQAFLIKYYGNEREGVSMHEPMHTVTARDRFGLVNVRGTEYAISDIGLRMLQPRELYRAQGFPEFYHIGDGSAGLSLTKTAQVRMCGNSVCPPMASALVEANASDMAAWSKNEKEKIAL